jgi:hypothetical protein
MSNPQEFTLSIHATDPVSEKSEEMKEDSLKPKHPVPPNPDLEPEKKEGEVNESIVTNKIKQTPVALRVFEHSTNKSCQTLHTISLCCAHSFSN